MRCQHCQSRDALERDGIPVQVQLFGEIEGCFCAECIVALQEPYNRGLRADIAIKAPELSELELESVPDQMLKFTLCFPIPRQPV